MRKILYSIVIVFIFLNSYIATGTIEDSGNFSDGATISRENIDDEYVPTIMTVDIMCLLHERLDIELHGCREKIYNWTGETHKFKVEWSVENPYEDIIMPATIKVRVREWMDTTGIPQLLFFLRETGSVTCGHGYYVTVVIELPAGNHSGTTTIEFTDHGGHASQIGVFAWFFDTRCPYLYDGEWGNILIR